MRENHPDKGGSDKDAQEISRGYRLIKLCLDTDRRLPLQGAEQTPRQRTERTATRPAYQAPPRAENPFAFGEEFGEFEPPRTRRRRQRPPNTRQESNEDSAYGSGERSRHGLDSDSLSSDDEAGARARADASRQQSKPFVNGYEYNTDDESDFVEPPFNKGRDRYRRCRGGLLLMDDVPMTTVPGVYEDFARTGMTEEECERSSEFSFIVTILRHMPSDLREFAEKMKDNEKHLNLRSVRLEAVDESKLLFRVDIRHEHFDEDALVPNMHIDVSSKLENGIMSRAVVESVDHEKKVMKIMFLDDDRAQMLLQYGTRVSISANCSTFVQRSLMRSLTCVVERSMDNLLYPDQYVEVRAWDTELACLPLIQESDDAFVLQQQQEIEQMPFIPEDEFNADQKRAIHSIVHGVHGRAPFVLFGPPGIRTMYTLLSIRLLGTGKTVTLIEAIRHLVMKDKNNRILVCTPSRMAADNFAEAIFDRHFCDHKYIFRMHSQSTSAIGRKKKLDPIVFLPKECKERLYGLPRRENLKMFRVIICTLSTSSYLISAGGLRGFFTHIFVDEAGQATEPETWIPIGGLAHTNTKIALAGDPKQLGPVVQLNLSKKETYRAHYKILRPVSYLFYDNLLQPPPHDLYNDMCDWEGLPEPGFPIIFHSSVGSQEEQSAQRSYSNKMEMDIVIDYVKRLLDSGRVQPSEIGVISPYKFQTTKLRKELKDVKDLTIDSVEGFQGSERKVIIITTSRTTSLGFLADDNRLNTSISRAKNLLIVIGCDEVLRQHNTWKKFVFYCRFHNGYIGEGKCWDVDVQNNF
ncbi:RNA helicase [Aphelenchoides avenae]|nr:RNA helicase [Aphelenchus avenae]